MLSHVAPFPRVTSACAPVQAPWEPPAWGQCALQACKESVQWVRPSQVRCHLYMFGGLPLKPRCVVTPSPVTSFKVPHPHWYLVANERQAQPRLSLGLWEGCSLGLWTRRSCTPCPPCSCLGDAMCLLDRKEQKSHIRVPRKEGLPAVCTQALG